MKLPDTRTLAMIAVAVLLVIGMLWLRSCQAERAAKSQAKVQTNVRAADAIAAEARQEDQTTIASDKQEITNALEAIPDATLTDRQRARYCSVWLRQNPGTRCPAAR